MGLAMFVAVPASVLMIALGEPIVVAVFQRGAFDAAAAHETARALLWQGGAIWTVAAVRQTVPALYAMGDTRTPVIVSGVDLLAFIGLAVGLRGPMGHVGISVAVAGSSAVQMVLLLAGLRRRLGTIEGATLARSAGRTLLASLLAGVAGWGAAAATAPRGDAPALPRILPGIAGLAGFSLVFLLAAWGLRTPELEEIVRAFRRRLSRGSKRSTSPSV
jgi:putative peptidoglycan lipid II flippase